MFSYSKTRKLEVCGGFEDSLLLSPAGKNQPFLVHRFRRSYTVKSMTSCGNSDLNVKMPGVKFSPQKNLIDSHIIRREFPVTLMNESMGSSAS